MARAAVARSLKAMVMEFTGVSRWLKWEMRMG
jgi:hypothetical protein